MPIQLEGYANTYVIDIDELSKNINMLREKKIEILRLKKDYHLRKKRLINLTNQRRETRLQCENNAPLSC